MSKLRLPKGQMSESLPVAALLALSGGYMDAYTYTCRGQVFANAQTGNMIRFGIAFAEGRFAAAAPYLLAIMMFASGIFVADIIRRQDNAIEWLHWRQLSVLIEAAIMLIAAFIPQRLNFLANVMISFACGVQVQSFRSVCKNAMATTMCIGNMRSVMQNLCDYCFSRNPKSARRAGLYAAVIGLFVSGAVCGNFAVRAFGEYAIIASSILLLAAFIIMFKKEEEEEREMRNEKQK